jgi:hypothetical protein
MTIASGFGQQEIIGLLNSPLHGGNARGLTQFKSVN